MIDYRAMTREGFYAKRVKSDLGKAFIYYRSPLTWDMINDAINKNVWETIFTKSAKRCIVNGFIFTDAKALSPNFYLFIVQTWCHNVLWYFPWFIIIFQSNYVGQCQNGGNSPAHFAHQQTPKSRYIVFPDMDPSDSWGFMLALPWDFAMIWLLMHICDCVYAIHTIVVGWYILWQ